MVCDAQIIPSAFIVSTPSLAKSARARFGRFCGHGLSRRAMPWRPIAALASCLAKCLAPFLASAKCPWHTLKAQPGYPGRAHAKRASTTAPPMESVDRVAQMSEPLLVVAHTLSVQRTVEEVLLSSDLLPHILAQLRAEDGAAAAAVCSWWNDCWEEILDAKLPMDLKYWSLYDFGDVTDSDAEEEDCLARLDALFGHQTFDMMTRQSRATLWVKSKGLQRIVRQVRSLAQAVQAQEEAEDTATYLVMKHPFDRKSKEDWEEWGYTAAQHDAYDVKYHHKVPPDRWLRRGADGVWRFQRASD